MLAGLPVGVGHGELVEVGEQRRHHGVRRARNPAAAVAGVPVRRRHVFSPFLWRASRAPVMERNGGTESKQGKSCGGGGAGYGGGSRKPFEPESESEKAEIATTRTRGAPLWD